jgi:uncharacterized membrane protein
MIYFVLYSFLGWVGDTAYRSFEKGRYVRGSFLPIPFMPVYGFGALLVLALDTRFRALPLPLAFVLYGSLLAVLELLTGFCIKKYFKRRLWKYDGGVMNIGGFTNLAHAALWGALAMVVVVLQPQLERIFGPLW